MPCKDSNQLSELASLESEENSGTLFFWLNFERRTAHVRNRMSVVDRMCVTTVNNIPVSTLVAMSQQPYNTVSMPFDDGLTRSPALVLQGPPLLAANSLEVLDVCLVLGFASILFFLAE